jgi:lipopolysaccharide export system permease protein
VRLHDRYLFRELLAPLGFCVAGFLVFWISIFFTTQVETIHEKKLTLGDSLAYCAASLPETLVQLLPMLLLLALLYALTHHARYNELTALRAAGVSLWRLCAPYFATGLLATGVYFVINEFAVPQCQQWEEEILERHVHPDASPKIGPAGSTSVYNARERRYWTFVEFDSRTTQMGGPITVKWAGADGKVRVLRAESAAYTNGVWTFFNAETFLPAQQAHTSVTNMLAMPEFDETPDRLQILLKFSSHNTLHGSVSADIPLAELWEYLRSNPGLSPEDAHAWETKFHERLASPWTCFVVVLVAIPFGAQTGRRNLFVGVAGSIFIGFVYFILQRVSLAMGMGGELPGWVAAWLPNVIFAIGGILLAMRVR